MTGSEDVHKGGPLSKDSKPIASGLAFSGLVQTRNTEATLRWLGFQFGLGLNLAGWSAVLVWALQNPTILELAIALLACAGGVTYNRLHFTVVARDGKFMELWNKKALELEEANGVEGDVEIFSSPEHLELNSRQPSIQEVVRRCIIFQGMVWAILAVAVMLVMVSKGVQP